MKEPFVASAVALLLVQFGVADAQVSGDDAKCRAAFQKTLSKYNDTIHKTIAGCWKGVLKGKEPADTDCNTLSVADGKGKAAKARQKLVDTVGGAKTKCDDGTHATALAEFASGCPSPAAGPISSWLEARDCAIAITEFQAEQVWRYSFDPPAADVGTIVADNDLNKCATGIHKTLAKLSSTAGKERGKAQAGSDKSGGSYDFLQGNADPKLKIAGARTKLDDAIDGNCSSASTAELAALNSCRTDIAGLKQCLAGPWERNGSGVTSMAYEQAGICPDAITVRIDAGKGGGTRLNETRLDSGWTGLGHDVDVSDGFVGSVSISCADSSCGACTPSLRCDAVGNNCRCANDVTIVCDTPNAADPACGGNVCEVHFGPPLPLSASNTPICAVNKIADDLVAVVPADIGTGQSTTAVNTVTLVHTGIDQSQPCPVCTGAAVGDAGICVGGPRDGLDCTTNATHVAFGTTSYDCPADTDANVSGSGLQLNLVLSDGPSELPMGTSCTVSGGGTGLLCACAVCSGGANLPCNGDADCPDGETCSTHAQGQPTQPNGCSDLICTDGLCAAQAGLDIVRFCDNYTRGDGSGILTCSNNAECDNLDEICPSGNCGNCTLETVRSCFTSGQAGDVISASGSPGTDGAVLASTFCIPPTSSGSVNASTGIPGPSRLTNAFRFTPRCANGELWQFPGGSNCQ